ncbi:hypothetical protein BKA60DRAFT_636751 [Fusarium oxysporum]|nr:hypothetical protein BKA60DRAFT_636751 [Fusarium oxysporum]
MPCNCTLPRDISALEIGGNNYVFFVNGQDQLSYLVSPAGQVLADYQPQCIQLDGLDLKVKHDSRQIAAVAWTANNVDEIRVYCIMQNDQGKGYLQEVCFSSNEPGQAWYQGLLGSEKCVLHVDSCPSLAAIGRGWQDLKIFSSGKNEDGKNRIRVYYYTKENGGLWTERTISNRFQDW